MNKIQKIKAKLLTRHFLSTVNCSRFTSKNTTSPALLSGLYGVWKTILGRLLLGLSSLFEASAAINGLVARGLKGELSLSTALAAGSIEILSCGTVCILLSVAAGLASLGLVGVALLCIESLLTGGENKLVAALNANESLISVFYCCGFFDFGTFDLEFFVHVLPRVKNM